MMTKLTGTYVLGVHRSGTSVLAGVLNLLGLDPGEPEHFFDADRFNSDGYWERQDIVDFHDRALRRLGGWASAPPQPFVGLDRRIEGMVEEVDEIIKPFGKPWMVKDPRQCLLLPLWLQARNGQDLHVLSIRHPSAVQRSFQRRNGYSADLALGLWERYMFEALRNSRGRKTLIIDYDALTSSPRETTALIAEVLTTHVFAGVEPSAESFESAVHLVRPSRSKRSNDPVDPRCEALYESLVNRTGFHAELETGPLLLAGLGREALARRRRRLNAVRPLAKLGPVAKGKLDRRIFAENGQ